MSLKHSWCLCNLFLHPHLLYYFQHSCPCSSVCGSKRNEHVQQTLLFKSGCFVTSLVEALSRLHACPPRVWCGSTYCWCGILLVILSVLLSDYIVAEPSQKSICPSIHSSSLNFCDGWTDYPSTFTHVCLLNTPSIQLVETEFSVSPISWMAGLLGTASRWLNSFLQCLPSAVGLAEDTCALNCVLFAFSSYRSAHSRKLCPSGCDTDSDGVIRGSWSGCEHTLESMWLTTCFSH